MSSLSYLRYRKRTVSNQLYSKRSLVDDIEEKIARLKRARSELSSVLSDVRSVKGSINRFTISSNSWRGEKENKFEDKYDRYKDSIKSYVRKVEDAKDTMDDDIRRYESQRSSYLSSISSLRQSLNSLNWQIYQAEREWS